MAYMVIVNDAGLAGYIDYFGKREGIASLSHKHGKSWAFESSIDYKEWSDRYYKSEFAGVNDATVRMLKMRG